MRLTRLKAALAAMIFTTPLVVVLAAQPAAASATCGVYASSPGWYDGAQTMPEGTGLTSCSATMRWVRVDLELDVARSGQWVAFSTDSYVTYNSTSAYWFTTAECKDTGAANYTTGARGAALWTDSSGVNQYYLNDPGDGASMRWSGAVTLNCGNPPPPPDPKQGVGGIIKYLQGI